MIRGKIRGKSQGLEPRAKIRGKNQEPRAKIRSKISGKIRAKD